MAFTIKKIHLVNYRQFRDYTIEANDEINILVGDNEAGKSTILEAIDLVISGSQYRFDNMGLDSLLNIDAVEEFLNLENKTFEDLPSLIAELYFDGPGIIEYEGYSNCTREYCNGIRLVCAPNESFQNEINEILESGDSDYFPYDYYLAAFTTFTDHQYYPQQKGRPHSVLIDSSSMGSQYATADFVKRMYSRYTEGNHIVQAFHKSTYRQSRSDFSKHALSGINDDEVLKSKKYKFGLRNLRGKDFESDLMIFEDKISVDNKGSGKQVVIKTEFAFQKSGDNVDIILLEEPENHLSPVNLQNLVQTIRQKRKGQIFVATHNNFICTRLELNNLLIMNKAETDHPISLSELSDDTRNYFIKMPPAGIIEFVLSKKTILVEGPSEYLLMEKFYEAVHDRKPQEDGVAIIDVRGLSFKRYLDIALKTGCKVAVITDNDGEKGKGRIDSYKEYESKGNIRAFSDPDLDKHTFEICFEKDNVELCKRLFKDDAAKYMLTNKTEAAYKILDALEKSEPWDADQLPELNVPKYIEEAILWITPKETK